MSIEPAHPTSWIPGKDISLRIRSKKGQAQFVVDDASQTAWTIEDEKFVQYSIILFPRRRTTEEATPK